MVNDQWHIAYTPDLVISQWVGFEKTDENHYIDSASYWKAPSVFRTVANAILPHTAGTKFDVENAYAKNGIVKVAEDETPQSETTANQDQNQAQEISEQAKNLIEQTKKSLVEARIPERAKNLWDNLTTWFEGVVKSIKTW